MFVNDTAIEFFSNGFILAKINAEQDTLTAQRYSVLAYPTTVLVGKNGEEIDRLVGYAPATEFTGILEDYSNGIGTLADLLGQAEDSVERELYYEIGDKYKYRGKSEEAEAWYNRVIQSGEPTDSLSAEARMALADMYRRAGDYELALSEFQDISKEFAGTDHGRDADIWQAIVYKRMGDTAKALDQFAEFIKKYPEAEDAEYAADQIRILTTPPEESAN